MPFRIVKLQPGVNLEMSQTLNKVQLAVTNLCRFYGGLVQKLGGWLQLTSETFVGVCRGLVGWADIVGNPYLAVGTNERLEVVIRETLYDITPLADTTNPAVRFSTANGTPNVTITDAGYGPSVGDWIHLLTQVSVGGIVLLGFYQVDTVVDATHYTIVAAANATSTVVNGGAVPSYGTTNTLATINVTLANHGLLVAALFEANVLTTVATIVIFGSYSVTSVTNANVFVITAATNANATTTASENGGNARIDYLIPSGGAVTVPAPPAGYGTSVYGTGLYGTSDGAADTVPLRQWSLDHWGQDLIASPSNGAIYYWVPPTPVPATVIAAAPLYSTAVFVMPQVQILVSLGAETGGVQEPLLSRWSDQGNFNDWTPSAINQAGSYFYPTGSSLVGGLAVGLGAVVWTDQDVWSMTYLGFPLVFGFNRVAMNCGLIAQRAAGVIGSFVMWLGRDQFYQYSVGGGVDPMECSVWDFYWNNVDPTQPQQIHCAGNSVFNEMAWHFPLKTDSPCWSETTPLGYVKYNLVEKVWDYGCSDQYQRTAWTNHSPVGNPVGADIDGLLQQHEQGNDANGDPMIGGWQTGYFDLAEGEEYPFIDLIIPDFVLSSTFSTPPVLSMSLLTLNYPIGQTPETIGPYTVNTMTGGTYFVPLRARARQIALAVAWSDIGSFNRIGAIRIRYAPDGRN